MNSTPTPLSKRIFRFLLRLLPDGFQSDYSREMEHTFEDQSRKARELGGLSSLARLWWETLKGIFQIAPREHWEILKQDFGYALRMMRKNTGFTVMAVLILAFGIGANTAIFSVVQSVLLRSLPYPNAQQLVFIRQQAQKEAIDNKLFSVQEIQDYREQNRTLASLAEYHTMNFILLGQGDPDRVRAAVVSANYFDLFEVKPLLGRTFLPDDDKMGAPPVLILSNEYWKAKFGADPGVVGKTVEMNDKVHTIVGVLPIIPQYPAENDVFMPTSACPFRSSKNDINNRDIRYMEIFGRLKPGVSVAQAHADFSTISSRLKSAYPQSYPDNEGYAIITTLLQDELTSRAKPTLLMLLAGAAFVLLIACANVANLTLARMSRRERELALRAALGAGRSRILRQLLTESFLIALLGGVLGLIVAYGSLPLLIDFVKSLTPRAYEIRIDTRVLIFTLFAALGTSFVFGTLAAFFTRSTPSSSLKETGSSAGQHKNRVRSFLIVSQIAFSFILLIGAGLMLRSLIKMQQVNPGFVAERVLVMHTTFSPMKSGGIDELAVGIKKILDRVRAEPGVQSAAISSTYPLEPKTISNIFTAPFQIEGRQINPGEAPPVGSFIFISPDYFRALGIPLKAGREFTEKDGGKDQHAAIINETMKRRFWPNEDPIGEHIGDNKIIGIIGDVREFGLDRPASPEIYMPEAQVPVATSLVVRTATDPRTMADAISRAVHEVNPQVAVTHVRTLEQIRSDSIASPRVTASLLAIFGALALLIAAAGIGGIMALMVSQRAREIGIRLALGAQPSGILRMILGHGLWLTLLGIGIGVIGALTLKNLVKALLFEVAPTDLVTFAGVALVLLAAAAIASYLPALRAARIDPITALRMD